METIRYKSTEKAGMSLADQVAQQLKQAISSNGVATLAVAGGSTPSVFFNKLSNEQLDWSKVNVTTTDERMVEPDHPRSNSNFINKTLLINEASKASFYAQNGSVSVDELAEQFQAKFLPFDVCVLGMGNDGHTASLFPGTYDALNPSYEEVIAAVDAPGDLEPRITLTANALLKAKNIHLLIHGKEKWAVYQHALKGDDINEMPIRLLFQYAADRVQVHYAEEE